MSIRVTQWIANMAQPLLSLSFNLGGLLAGVLLAVYFNIFSLTPWSLALFPGILSIRGSIGGLFCGRLSTSLHLGTIRASFRGNTNEFKLLLYTVIIIALESSIIFGTTSSILGIFLWGITPLDVFNILVAITSTMAFSLILISPLTVGVAILSFKRGLDPDVIVYPVISTSADILVSICYFLSLIGLFTWRPLGTYILLFFDLIFAGIVLYLLKEKGRESDLIKTVKEFTLTLVFVTFIVNVTGFALGKISRSIGNRPEVYMVYPVLIDTLGDAGSIIGSTATTKLALGTVSSSLSSIKKHLPVIVNTWLASILIFVLCALVSSISFGATGSGYSYLTYIAQLLMTNIVAVFFVSLIAYTIALFTYRWGLDPDNFVIPLESSLTDAITTLSLLIAISVIP